MAESVSFRIRLMEPDDLDQAFSLSRSEGWNQTMEDWIFLFQNPANVCIVAEKDGRIAGTATALVHDSKVAWIGMVLVDKSLRGQGAGKMLMEDIISRLSHIPSVKLDATPAGEPLYTKLGFKAEDKVIRMTCEKAGLPGHVITPRDIYTTGQENISEITDFDSEIFGVSRAVLIHHLINKAPELSFCQTGESGLRGFILGRKGSRFTYIGPAEALTAHSAIQLISAALLKLSGKPVALDISEDKHEVTEWLESAGFVKQRYFTRMYLNINPFPGSADRQFLISGPEFG